MKKFILAASVLILAGAGCAGAPVNAPKQNNPATNQPTANVPANGNTPVSDLAPTDSELQELPKINEDKAKIDDSAWTSFITKTGVNFRYPAKGPYAPTWEYQVLKKDDPHLRGNCYVTAQTKYKRIDSDNLVGACQTTTTIDPTAGERTDYFVYESSDRLNMFTLTKKYTDKFDMESYDAVVDRIFNIID